MSRFAMASPTHQAIERRRQERDDEREKEHKRRLASERALNEPRLVRGVLAADGDVTGVVFYFELPHKNPAQEIAAVADAARALVAEVQQAHPQIEFHLSGLILFNEAMAGAIPVSLLGV